MKNLLFLLIFFPLASFNWQDNKDNERYLLHNQKEIKTTFEVDQKFYGLYKGRKSGFLLLKNDGTGAYKYDYQAFLPENCEPGEITFNWGFILDESGEPLKFERTYGYSYPILYSCSGSNSFQGCTRTSLIDYILVYKDGTMTVSSSDDWKKQ